MVAAACAPCASVPKAVVARKSLSGAAGALTPGVASQLTHGIIDAHRRCLLRERAQGLRAGLVIA